MAARQRFDKSGQLPIHRTLYSLEDAELLRVAGVPIGTVDKEGESLLYKWVYGQAVTKGEYWNTTSPTAFRTWFETHASAFDWTITPKEGKGLRLLAWSHLTGEFFDTLDAWLAGHGAPAPSEEQIAHKLCWPRDPELRSLAFFEPRLTQTAKLHVWQALFKEIRYGPNSWDDAKTRQYKDSASTWMKKEAATWTRFPDFWSEQHWSWCLGIKELDERAAWKALLSPLRAGTVHPATWEDGPEMLEKASAAGWSCAQDWLNMPWPPCGGWSKRTQGWAKSHMEEVGDIAIDPSADSPWKSNLRSQLLNAGWRVDSHDKGWAFASLWLSRRIYNQERGDETLVGLKALSKLPGFTWKGLLAQAAQCEANTRSVGCHVPRNVWRVLMRHGARFQDKTEVHVGIDMDSGGDGKKCWLELPVLGLLVLAQRTGLPRPEFVDQLLRQPACNPNPMITQYSILRQNDLPREAPLLFWAALSKTWHSVPALLRAGADPACQLDGVSWMEHIARHAPEPQRRDLLTLCWEQGAEPAAIPAAGASGMLLDVWRQDVPDLYEHWAAWFNEKMRKVMPLELVSAPVRARL